MVGAPYDDARGLQLLMILYKILPVWFVQSNICMYQCNYGCGYQPLLHWFLIDSIVIDDGDGDESGFLSLTQGNIKNPTNIHHLMLLVMVMMLDMESDGMVMDLMVLKVVEVQVWLEQVQDQQ